MKLLVLTSYPERHTTHSSKTVGVASYTKTLLTAMKKLQPDSSISIFAEVLSRPETYDEDGITVERVWQRNSLGSLFSVLTKLAKRPEKDLLVSFEVYMFGSPLANLSTLIGLSLLRLFGKRITTVVHQVLGDPKQLEKNPIKVMMLQIMKKVLYRLLLISSTHVIVFEEQLKKQLPTSAKVSVIPHLISEPQRIAKDRARKELGLNKDNFYVLYFGYLSPYKGLEELLDNFSTTETTQLIVAGGPNPNHKTNTSYMEYVQIIEKKMTEKKVIQTGFVPEEKVPLYFSAADVLILPYTTFMSSSGPLALALAYELPILLSEELAPYAKTQDIAHALKQADLTLSDITFKRNDAQILTQQLSFTRKNYTKLATFSRIIKEARSESVIANKFWEVLS